MDLPIKWTVEPFNKSYAPGAKDFDFDINQITIAKVRARPVIKEPARQGLIMLRPTHAMGFARPLADHGCFLEASRILRQAKPERIFTAPDHPRTRQFLGR